MHFWSARHNRPIWSAFENGHILFRLCWCVRCDRVKLVPTLYAAHKIPIWFIASIYSVAIVCYAYAIAVAKRYK